MTTFSAKKIAKAIYAEAKDKNGSALEHVIVNARDFLIKKNLLSKSSEILNHLQEIVDGEAGIVRAKVISAERLSGHKLQDIKHSLLKRYRAEHILLETEEDAALIGGMRVETKDEIIDMSLKSRLKQLHTHLSQ